MAYQAQLLESLPAEGTHLAVEEAGYFGARLSTVRDEDLLKWDLHERAGDGLYRHSYLYRCIFKIGVNDYGGIQLRGRLFTYRREVPSRLRDLVEQTAHRAASCFDTAAVTGEYSGYLSGFNPFDAGTAWESEEVASATPGAQVGKVDWNVEVYDDDSFADPDLSGIAQGLAYPWTATTETVTKQPPRETFKLRYLPSRDEYEVQTRSGSRARGKQVLAGKTAYVNDRPIGRWKKGRGRVSIKAEYSRPPTIDGREVYDRERLLAETEATPQALRDGGNLYKVEETAGAIYFVTAARRPAEWNPTDSDEIPADMGVETTEETRLSLRGHAEASALECRRDERVIRHLGLSSPDWNQRTTREWSV